MMQGKTALYIDGVAVAFGSLRAVDGLSMFIRYGEVRAIIGPNGAGKTTFLDIITGKTRPDSGVIELDGGIDLLALTEPKVALAGVGRKFQKPSVFEALSVEDNLKLSLRNPAFGMTREMFRTPTVGERERMGRVLETIGMQDMQSQSAGVLSHGEKQWLEIGMLLLQEPKVLLLDEPVAGMTHAETERTVELVKSLRAPERAVVVIEHDMSFVEKIADVVSVLHEGRLLVEGSMEHVQSDERVRDVYLGR